MPCLARVSIDTDNDPGINTETLPRESLEEPLDTVQRGIQDFSTGIKF